MPPEDVLKGTVQQHFNFYWNAYMNFFKAPIPFFILLGFLSQACGGASPEVPPPPQISEKKLQEELIEVNQRMIQEEQWLIKKYLERRNLPFESFGTGLHLVRLSKPLTGSKPKAGDYVQIEYSASLLDGTPCFRSEEAGEVLRLAFDPIESGLQDGILKMQTGEECLLLIPSHLAFGLLGDLDKIPPYTPVAYKVKLMRIQP